MTKEQNKAPDVESFAPESNEPQLKKPKSAKKKGGGGIWVILVIIIIILAALFYLDVKGIISLFGQNSLTPNQENEIVLETSGWKAVFLTNGQVYFGKMDKMGAAYPELSDIYYLQVQNVPIQPAEPANPEAGVQPAQDTQQQMILVKFGTELHRPKDKMFINKDHIMFYEDLNDDSPVVTSINEYLVGQQQVEVTE